MKTKNCQSCGMPLSKDPQGSGTNADGTKSNIYCSCCYQNGQLAGAHMTVKEFQEFCRQELIKNGHSKFTAWLLTRGMKRLERWNSKIKTIGTIGIIGGADGPTSITVNMKQTADFTNVTIRILLYINEWEQKLKELEPAVISLRRNEQNRTIKQIIGHMIDSASNNTHRIIHLQYQDSPLIFPDYAGFGNNDRWIAIQNYQKEEWNDLIQLWIHTNKHFAHIIQYIDPTKINNQWISATGDQVSLESMVIDYTRHMALHLGEIEELINDKNSE